MHLEQATQLVGTAGSTRRVRDRGRANARRTRRCRRPTSRSRSFDLIRACKDDVARGKLPADTDCDAQTSSRWPDSLRATIAGKTKASVPMPRSRVCRSGAVHRRDHEQPPRGLPRRRYDDARRRPPRRDRVRTRPWRRHVPSSSSPTRRPSASRAACALLHHYLLANDKVRVVVQSIQRNILNVGQYGGQIIDVTCRAPGDPDRDNFEEWRRRSTSRTPRTTPT
ncbi:MAG: hypothetical protein U1E86_28415 [Burkholderiaceae bacterium]